MAYLRFKALEMLSKRTKVRAELPSGKVSDFFGQQVFGKEEMKSFLSPGTFKKVIHAIEHGEKIDSTTADAVATAAKNWAMSKNVTHFTHWFQPLT
jgi:glutamine synthetase